MKYFFILGKNPTISFAELVSVLNLKPEQVVFLSREAAVIDVDEDVGAVELTKRLGGTIKIGVINFQLSTFIFQSIINSQLSPSHSAGQAIFNKPKIEGKFKFGISYYGEGQLKQEKILAMEFKKALKKKGVNSRWVTSREKQLSSVVVEQNKLTTEKGAEMVIINDGRNYHVGKTLAVQPFKELSRRDYGRPGRDDRSGMLPPKLAQILINLSEAEKGGVLLDPFCGSGTILTEAALMGFKDLVGCDNSEKAIEDTRRNVEFLISNFKPACLACASKSGRSNPNLKISNDEIKLTKCDVRKLSQCVTQNSVDTIITEPYLGPSRMKFTENNIKKVAQELEQLYHQAFIEFEKVLKSDGRVVMIWPVFRVGTEKIMLSAKKILAGAKFKIINPLEGFNNKMIKLTNRQTIIYGRVGQKVWREVVILEK